MANRLISENLILIVEDDPNTASLISIYLEREGYAIAIAHDGEKALELARRRNPMFVVLDLMLPRLDGWEVCRQLREFSDVPLLMLTARGEEVDRVRGLTIGADDYLVKPFSPRELVARVKAILRRVRPGEADASGKIAFGELVLDVPQRRLVLSGRRIVLTPSEFKLIRLLMSAPGRLHTREQLLNVLYPHGEEVVDRVIDVHIGKLRQKIEKDPANPRYILTVRGYGYQFAEPTDRREEY
jgi:DNA-binding response OmpR family regulator